MSVEKIINKILEDARLEAQRILSEAEKTRLNELESTRQELLKKSNEIIEKSAREAELIKQRSESRMLLEKKKQESILKEKIINAVIDDLIKRLQEKETEILAGIYRKLIKESMVKGEVRLKVSKSLKNIFNSRFLSSLNKEVGGAKFLLEEGEPEGSEVEISSDNFSIKINLRDYLLSRKTDIAKMVFDLLGF